MLLEYGDVWDMMGGPLVDGTDAEPRRRHFNAFFKWLAGWLPRSTVDVTRSGTFRLYRHDIGDAAGTCAIRIDADSTTWYWLDIRRQFSWNHSMLAGVEVRKETKNPPYSYGVVRLLDMDTRAGTPRIALRAWRPQDTRPVRSARSWRGHSSHPREKSIARHTSRILVAQARHPPSDHAVVHGEDVVEIDGTACFNPSSLPRGTSEGTPRIDAVTGATVTRDR